MVVKLRVQIKLRQALRLFVSARKRGVWFDRDALEIVFVSQGGFGTFHPLDKVLSSVGSDA